MEISGVGPLWKRPVVIDAVVVVVLAAVLMILVSVASEPGARAVSALAYVIVGVLAAIQMFRRRWPVGILILSLALNFMYHALDYPAIGNLPLAVPLFTAALMGHTVVVVAAAAYSIVGTFGWMLAGESQPVLFSFSIVAREAAVMVAVIMAGIAIRNRRLLSVETRERLRLARVEQEGHAVSERMRIARELHDIVAHTVAVIGVQARVAADTLDDSPDQARLALDIISTSTREATSELRATIDVLREGEDTPLSPTPTISQVPALVESVATGGLPVELRVSGEERRLAGSVELIAYRVIQESLTNVVRHSNASRAEVEITYLRELLAITVTDDGTGGQVGSGFGIRGMRERVLASGGNLAVGPTGNGGFQVRAEIPVAASQ